MDSKLYWEGVIDIPTRGWIYTVEELEKGTPSRLVKDPKGRISFPDEIIKRCKGVVFIFNSCRYLKLSRSVALTASTLFHRCYMKYDLNSNHYYEIGTTCIFIACKSEECRRKLSDVIKVCARIATGGREVIDEESKIYWQWKDLIVNLEEKLLNVFEFDVAPLNPYVITAQVLDVQLDQHLPVKGGIDPEWLKKSPTLFGNCVNALEMMVRLPILVLFPVEVLCALVIVYSSKKTGIHVSRAVFQERLNIETKDVIRCHEIAIRYATITDRLDPKLQVNLPSLSPAEIETLLV